jgi:putative SOS response-associated peptidase YedK
MCGRYAIISVPEAMRRLFRYAEQPNFPPRYNVAPTQPVPVVRIADGARHFALMRWGLLPAWVKDPRSFTLLINARAETAHEKPAFRNAMKRRRCLIPADGFYEWRREGTRKQPFFIRRKDRAPFAFAGLWETWAGPGGEEMDTAAILTTQANETLRALHHRMPVIVPPEAFDLWLDEGADARMIASLLVPAPNDQFELFAVSDAVNKVANDDPRNIESAPAESLSPAVPPSHPAKPAKRPAADDDQMTLF